MKQFDLLKESNILICAHRGSSGGNIPCNTLTAFDIALMQRAEMIELDVTASIDGELFVFHPKMEKRMLSRNDVDIRKMSATEVKTLRYVNFDGVETKEGIPLLDDAFEHLKGRCYINVDKFAHNPQAIINKVKAHGLENQVLLKSSPREAVLSVLEQSAPKIPFLAILSDKYGPEYHGMLMKRDVGYAGAEVVFANDESPLAQREYIEKLHKDGKLAYVNSILFNYKTKLAGEHSDDTAMGGDLQGGWGWLADMNFDIIQTDWVRELGIYLDATDRKKKRWKL